MLAQGIHSIVQMVQLLCKGTYLCSRVMAQLSREPSKILLVLFVLYQIMISEVKRELSVMACTELAAGLSKTSACIPKKTKQ